MSKKLEQKQQRRLAEERKKEQAQREQRKKNLVTLLIAVVVIGLVAALVVSERKEQGGPVGVAESEANCGAKEEVEASGNDHMEEGVPVEYPSAVPAAGPHAASPIAAGFYTDLQEPEHVVHNMEHGQIVIWYSLDAPEQVKTDIEAIVDREPATTVATPYEGLEDYNFYMAAWNKPPGDDKEEFGTGYFQGCDLVSQEVVDAFRTEHQGKSPEPITPPFKG